MAPPRGPVYLSLPRETLAAPWHGGRWPETPKQAAPSVPFPDPAAWWNLMQAAAAAAQPAEGKPADAAPAKAKKK